MEKRVLTRKEIHEFMYKVINRKERVIQFLYNFGIGEVAFEEKQYKIKFSDINILENNDDVWFSEGYMKLECDLSTIIVDFTMDLYGSIIINNVDVDINNEEFVLKELSDEDEERESKIGKELEKKLNIEIDWENQIW